MIRSLFLYFIALTRIANLNCLESFMFSQNCLCLMDRIFKSQVHTKLQYLTIYLLAMAHTKKPRFIAANNNIIVAKKRKSALQEKPR